MRVIYLNKKILVKVHLLLFTILMPVLTFAQDEDPSDGPSPPPGAPIDIYTNVLLLIALLFALWFIIYKKRSKELT